MIALEKDKYLPSGSVPWTSCKPFVENSMGVLIHRPRRVTKRQISERYKPHLSVQSWCGNTMNGGKKFTFLDAPGKGRIVCARCEDNAVSNGLPTSSALAGHHVHTGGVVAVARCCNDVHPIPSQDTKE